MVSPPYSANTFTDGADRQEVVFNGGALCESNFLGGGSFLGPFTPAAPSAGGPPTTNSCSFSGLVGQISATLTATVPIAMSVLDTVTYTDNPRALRPDQPRGRLPPV